MSTLYDTGNIVLTNAVAGDIGENNWSEASAAVMDSVTLNDRAAKIVKIVVAITNAVAFDGKLYIFSRNTSGTWDETNAGTQDPVGTTGQMICITCDAAFEISDTVYYFANNDTVVASKLWLAYYNDSADTCTVTVRIFYETMSLGS